MYRWIIILLLIIAAVSCYAAAGIMGLGIFIVLGLILELFFWREVISKFKKKKRSRHS